MAVPQAECEEMCYFFAHLHHDRYGSFPDTRSGISRDWVVPSLSTPWLYRQERRHHNRLIGAASEMRAAANCCAPIGVQGRLSSQ
jgi:hypothetical protein